MNPVVSPIRTDQSTQLAPTQRPGRWLDDWDPEIPEQWAEHGRSIARRNLIVSVACEFLGFCVWALWSIVVPQLPQAGFDLTVDQMFWLVAVPSLVGAALRIPYTLAVPVFGGRNWTVISALLLLIPLGGLFWAVQVPTISFGALLAIAALAGLGGGNFASSMANISFFYPQAEKGRALGLNAAGGNLGTAAVQFVVPLVVAAGAAVQLQRAALVFVPVVVIAAVAAWLFMDNLTCAKNDPREFAWAAKDRHTWIISLLYIGTFGSFIGFAVAFPTLLKAQFPGSSASLAFLGALVGAMSRPLGGLLADRIGGARMSLFAFGGLAIGALSVLLSLRTGSLVLFLMAFLMLFCATGIGNGSVYRMIPSVFRLSALTPADRIVADRKAAGAIGIAGAIGAVGGFLVPRAFAASKSLTGGIDAALWVAVGFYLLLLVVTYFVYARSTSKYGAGQV